MFVTGAEIVQPFFAIGRLDEPVLGTSAIAGFEDFAFPAVLRQTVLFIGAEFFLRLAVDQRDQRRFPDVAKPVLRIDEMIAGIKFPRMLDDHDVAAGFPQHAQ